MKFIIFLSLILLFVGVFGDEAAEAEQEAVVTLTDDTFDEFIKENPMVLVKFYAPWCGHCKRLAPEYEKAAKELQGKIVLAKVDATEEKEVSNRFQITGYPTLKFFRNGSSSEYEGGRTAETIIKWVEKVTRPAVSEITEKEVDEMKEKHKVIFVMGGDKESDMFTYFKDVADHFRDAGIFVFYPASEQKLYGHRLGEGTLEFTGATKADLEKFVEEEQFLLFGEIDGSNFNAYSERKQDLVWVCGDSEFYDSQRNIYTEAARKFRDDFSFVWLDVEKFGSHAEQHLNLKSFPGLVAQYKVDGKGGRFIMPSESNVTAESVISFLELVKTGKVTRDIKSGDVPEKNDDPVKIVVGKNFEEMVFQKDKDVMLEVYAPWCGHCKKFEPVYKELAETLAEKKNILIAKMDGTENEAPYENFEWTGFPTIFFVKAGSNPGDEPMLYEGDRTIDALLEFFKTNSVDQSDEASVKDEL